MHDWLCVWLYGSTVFDLFCVATTLLMCYFCRCCCLLYVFICGVLMMLSLWYLLKIYLCTSCKFWKNCFVKNFQRGDCRSFWIGCIMPNNMEWSRCFWWRKDTCVTICSSMCATSGIFCQQIMIDVILSKFFWLCFNQNCCYILAMHLLNVFGWLKGSNQIS